jgi:hypothetical protein
MSKSVLLSIKPKWCEKISSGRKTIEVRKNKPTMEVPFKVLIYCTKAGKSLVCDDEDGKLYYNPKCSNMNDIILNGKVIGEFICDRIEDYRFDWATFTAYGTKQFIVRDKSLREICLSRSQFNDYGITDKGNVEALFGWHISNLKIYDKPKDLSDFSKFGFGQKVPLKRPPQSRCYIGGVKK